MPSNSEALLSAVTGDSATPAGDVGGSGRPARSDQNARVRHTFRVQTDFKRLCLLHPMRNYVDTLLSQERLPWTLRPFHQRVLVTNRRSGVALTGLRFSHRKVRGLWL